MFGHLCPNKIISEIKIPRLFSYTQTVCSKCLCAQYTRATYIHFSSIWYAPKMFVTLKQTLMGKFQA